MNNKQSLLGKVRERGVGARTDEGATFEDVLAAEREDIRQSRKKRLHPRLTFQEASALEDQAPAEDLAGLAFSGGGIRSATFCLGVLQALSSADLLRRFDYLSTVSGGGYIGGWLTSWIKRSRRGVLDVQDALTKAREGDEASPLEFIRDYSNYLAPQPIIQRTPDHSSVWLRNTV
jgi:predicted acylesterase/phospholipase RssA